MRINIGCGQRPTKGWRNFDNSLSLRLAKLPLVPGLLRKFGLLDDYQYKFVGFARENAIEYGDAVRGLPLPAESCDAIYTSHMLEHLDRSGAAAFVTEAFRVLRPGGVLRISVPDIEKRARRYLESGDADAFVESTHLAIGPPTTFAGRLRLLLVGPRHHQWMYDGKSLSRLLERCGFTGVEVMPGGETKIEDPQSLDLHERIDESVYVEAEKPSTPVRLRDLAHASAVSR